jgi:hypothetical protein
MTSPKAPRGREPQAAGQPAIVVPANLEQLAADTFARVLSGRLAAGADLAEALQPIHDRLAAIERALGIAR